MNRKWTCAVCLVAWGWAGAVCGEPLDSTEEALPLLSVGGVVDVDCQPQDASGSVAVLRAGHTGTHTVAIRGFEGALRLLTPEGEVITEGGEFGVDAWTGETTTSLTADLEPGFYLVATEGSCGEGESMGVAAHRLVLGPLPVMDGWGWPVEPSCNAMGACWTHGGDWPFVDLFALHQVLPEVSGLLIEPVSANGELDPVFVELGWGDWVSVRELVGDEAFESQAAVQITAVDEDGRALSDPMHHQFVVAPGDGLAVRPASPAGLCPPTHRRVAAQCERCEGGYSVESEPTVCRSCGSNEVLRFRKVLADGTIVEHPTYSKGWLPVCVCAPGFAEQEDNNGQAQGCESICAAHEIFIVDPANGMPLCVDKSLVGPGGQFIDTDGDGLHDFFEMSFGSNPNLVDTDGDGVNDFDEWYRHGDPNSADTDGDGLPDGDEFSKYQTALNNSDTDGDGLDDGAEIQAGTNPHDSDTDNDGLTDGEETSLYAHLTDPLDDDTDDDALTDCQEVRATCHGVTVQPFYASNPSKLDTDGDGLMDFYERAYGPMDPTKTDTDGDGITDFVEFRYGLNGTHSGYGDADGDGRQDNDADGDSYTDHDELKQYKTHPNNPDTDGDGLGDYDEIFWSDRDPTDWDTDDDGLGDGYEDQIGTDIDDADSDNDGLDDGRELRIGTDPTDYDTDSDLLADGAEVDTHGTDPLLADTDYDGVNDWREVITDKTNPLLGPWQSDADGDGLSDALETALATDKHKSDTDGDGLSDGAEFRTHGTSPSWADTDLDGLHDGFEIQHGLNPTNHDTDGDGLGDEDEFTQWGAARAKKRERTLPNPPKMGANYAYEWFPGEVFPKGKSSIDTKYIEQWALGSCWYLSVVASIAQIEPTHIQNLIVDNGDGTYRVKLYKNTNLEPIWIDVDGRFPVRADGVMYAGIVAEPLVMTVNGKPETVQKRVLWPLLLEKAAAVWFGNDYTELNGGKVWRGMEPLLGTHTEWKWGGNWISEDEKKTYEAFIKRSNQLNMPLTFATPGMSKAKVKAECDNIAETHMIAYTKKVTISGGQVRHVFRNPWGHDHQLSMAQMTNCFEQVSLGLRNLKRPGDFPDKP